MPLLHNLYSGAKQFADKSYIQGSECCLGTTELEQCTGGMITDKETHISLNRKKIFGEICCTFQCKQESESFKNLANIHTNKQTNKR